MSYDQRLSTRLPEELLGDNLEAERLAFMCRSGSGNLSPSSHRAAVGEYGILHSGLVNRGNLLGRGD
jgi:hypothetical protein